MLLLATISGCDNSSSQPSGDGQPNPSCGSGNNGGSSREVEHSPTATTAVSQSLLPPALRGIIWRCTPRVNQPWISLLQEVSGLHSPQVNVVVENWWKDDLRMR